MLMDPRLTRKMVPITGRARSFLLVLKNKIERRGRQNKNNRPINLPNVIANILFNFTSLQSFDSGQALFVVFYFLISGLILNPQPFFPSVLPSLKLCLL